NGTSSTDENIWSQTIAVAPQTNFAFSTWIQSLTATNPVQLIFSINGNEIGTIMAASSPTCQWNQFYTNWNSGTATTALLSIKSKNPNGQISNYALDDIVFSPFSIQKDSIVISIDNPVVQTNNDTTICKGNSVQLNTTGADNYAWQPVTGLNNPNIGDPIATPDISTEYIVTGTTLSGCTDKDTVLITIDNPVVQTNNDTTICKGNSLQLNTIGANSYSWQPITGLSDPNIGNPVATPILNTEYIVTGTSSLGCADKDTVLIAIDDPVVQTNNDTTICKGSSIQLNTSGAASYSWQPVTGLSNPNIGNPMATPDVNTTYIVTGSSVWGCMATDTIEINILPLPVIIKSNDTTICVSGSVQLFAGGGQFYSWSPTAYLNNSTIPNPVATPPDKITYTVTVTDMNTCQNTDSIKVDVKSPNNFKIEPVDPVCANTPVQLQAIGGDTYAWQPAGTVSDSTIANPIAFPTQTTTYKVLLSDTSCHFSNTLSTLVTVWPLPNVVAQKDFDLDCSNTQSQLAASGALQYSWTPITSLNNPTIASPIAKPTITTQYIVKGIDVNGCMNYDTVTVKVDDVLNANYLMPNAFTPNNDGKNDCFGVKYWGRILQFEFSIFNRWGERIFYTQNPDDCWDGTYKNMAQDPGVYIYTIKAKTVCVNEIFRKGTFTLIR
ncbi:MAG: gliding motility-associated C-terminal domain-containing protein, partial [Chitinophagaceae bacterium]|nr:gliding motility-associated C-terminal domain-containing protein [Chitinophagaceae bacterium]